MGDLSSEASFISFLRAGFLVALIDFLAVELMLLIR